MSPPPRAVLSCAAVHIRATFSRRRASQSIGCLLDSYFEKELPKGFLLQRTVTDMAVQTLDVQSKVTSVEQSLDKVDQEIRALRVFLAKLKLKQWSDELEHACELSGDGGLRFAPMVTYEDGTTALALVLD